MGKRKTNTKINKVSFTFNGNTKAFDEFMVSLIYGYLNSDTMPKCEHSDIVGKVEIIQNSA